MSQVVESAFVTSPPAFRAGSEFTFATPIEPEELDVLVVEDNADDATMLLRMLNHLAGFTADVTIVQSLEEAHRAIAVKHYDVAIIDFLLGCECGLDIVTRLAEKNPSCVPRQHS